MIRTALTDAQWETIAPHCLGRECDPGRTGPDPRLFCRGRSHDQLRMHLADFLAAYNFARRLKTLHGLASYEYICKIWTSEPDRFILNPIHQMPGLNI